MIIATAGHVDHGKTLLVKTLTGIDTDRLPEERERGLTIDLGFAYRDLGDGELTGFIDVPGHERFIRTMLAGVSGIDVVLFVIAADDGPMPQTAEHLAILDLLKVERGVVALSKIDRVGAARAAEVTAEIERLLAPSRLAGCAILPVSGVTGVGVDALRAALLTLKRELPQRSRAGNFRLAIDRSFLLKGAGRIVTGTVISGSIDSGSVVCHAPGGGELRVRGIHAHNREAASAHAGQRCALNIAGAGLREGTVHRGDWMLAPAINFSTLRLDVELEVLAGEAHALANRTPVHVHIGAADVTGRVVTFDGKSIAPGGVALAQLLLDRPLHAVLGDRVVLRDQSARRTLGGGRVLDPLPDVRGRTRAVRLAYLEALRAPDAAGALTAALAALPDGVDLVRFAHTWNLTPEAAEQVWADADMVQRGKPTQPFGVARTRWQEFGVALEGALAACHAAAPERLGVADNELARRLALRLRPELWAALVTDLVQAGTVVRDGAVLRLPQHAPRRAPEDEALWRRVGPLLERAGVKAPVVHDMLAPFALSFEALEAFLLRASHQGYVVRVSPKRYFLPATIAHFEDIVRELAATQTDGVFTAAQFRDRVGIGRNAVIEVLEYFDRVGLTRRHGQVRILLRGAGSRTA